MREFLKGEDITVLKNGNILGGIISVETQKNSTVYGVKQYMSDSVSCAHTKDEYTVTIEMNVPSREGFLKESRMDSIELKTADGSETYRNCTVKSAWCRHKSCRFFNTENGARLREKRGYIMEYKENDLVLDVGQAESISEEIERESRRYSYGFTEEDEARER